MKEIDARGLSCPTPVLMAKKAIEDNSPNQIKILVDNEAAGENVNRFLQSQSYDVTIENVGADFQIIGKKGEKTVTEEVTKPDEDKEQQKIMIMVTTDRMGYGDDELGLKLMISFLKTVREMGNDLWRLVFVNNGVKLTIAEAETLPALKELEAEGLHILVCGTCLDFFQLLDKKEVGLTTNMLDIVMAMQFADKVINL
ncbi:sulfurtransferase-like selenium metabolism protein YedF [bacterium]|nr:sulfurtransferase-like selenium metabolism protein YedF [bacterium]